MGHMTSSVCVPASAPSSIPFERPKQISKLKMSPPLCFLCSHGTAVWSRTHTRTSASAGPSPADPVPVFRGTALLELPRSRPPAGRLAGHCLRPTPAARTVARGGRGGEGKGLGVKGGPPWHLTSVLTPGALGYVDSDERSVRRYVEASEPPSWGIGAGDGQREEGEQGWDKCNLGRDRGR